MKKIFTLLILLAVLLSAPKPAQAIVWKISDGTALRINPATKDIDDLVTIPAGTEYFEICGPFDYTFPGYLQYYDYYDHNDRDKPYWMCDCSLANFPHSTLRGRMLRALGYPTAEQLRNKGGDYAKYAVLTREEVLAIKKLDLNPNSYPGVYSSGGRYDRNHNLSNLEGLHEFRNLEELDISNSQLTGSGYEGFHYPSSNFDAWLAEEQAKKDLDPSYYVPDMRFPGRVDELANELNNRYGFFYIYGNGADYIKSLDCYYLSVVLRWFPNLKKLIMRNAMATNEGHREHLVLDFRQLPALEELDASGCQYAILDLANHSKIKKLNIDGSMIRTLIIDSVSNFEPNPDPENFRSNMLGIIKARNCDLETLDLSYAPNLEQLYCNDNMLTSLTFNENVALFWVECQNNNLTSLTIPGTWRSYYSGYLDCSKNNLTSLNLPNSIFLGQLYCWNNKLTELNLSACTRLWRLRMSNNKVTSLDVTNNTYLNDFYCNNNKNGNEQLSTITGFSGLTNLQYFHGNNNAFAVLDCSGMKKLRDFQITHNKVKELVFSNNPYLHTVICDAQGGKGADGRLLRTLKVDGCPSLTKLICNDNAILSLNASASTALTADKLEAWTQRGVEDVVVLDRDKICIELPNGVMKPDGQAAQFQTWATGGSPSGFNAEQTRTITRNGMTYLVLYDISEQAVGDAQPKADVDFYGKKKRYHYTFWDNNLDETLGKSVAKGYNNDNVTVTLYPYVMYVNPISKDIHSIDVANNEEPFYSGTIYLDYDAIVPAGATAYIAKRIKINQDLIYSTAGGGHQKVTADQLQLVPLVAGEGASEVVIPAYTPVYVKSATEFGLFSFDRNNHGGIEQALGYAQDGSHLTRDNILRGVLTDSAITKYSVLSLGRGRPKGSDDNGYTIESRIGFWPFSGTTIPAHRVFIPISELENAGGSSSSPGLLFSFTDDINENNTTDIRTAVISKDNGWYTIGGIRLSGRPTEKGIYIHNGRKEVIR